MDTVGTKWRLHEMLARHRITGAELAAELGVRPNTISHLRKQETLPEIGGDRLDEIAAAITRISRIGETVRGVDLLEDRDD